MSTPRSTVAYRPDIDGLRAIAVLAVVLYHLEIGPFAGGFVGVDIFFVISGYLITGIVQREIEEGRFTFGGFYERRVRRLFPALFVVLLATVLVGTWLLLPSDMVILGKSALATLFFGSNVLFWQHSGYFDSSAEFNPLLHTWSLAVEEQFYIGLPLLLLLTYRSLRKHLRSVLWLCAAASLLACVVVQPFRPSATFFLSPFRAWELLSGALLAVGAVPMVRQAWLREWLSAFGLLLLVASILWIRPGVAFPGWQALAPVLATGILIHVGEAGGSTVHRLLRFRPLVFIGLISYSLYLWHWPLLVFAKYANALEPLAHWRWGLLFVSLLMATISYHWIERPFRGRHGAFVRSTLFRRVGLATGLMAGACIGAVLLQGMPSRFSERVVTLDAARNPTIPFRECMDRSVGGNRVGYDLCVVGDAEASPEFWIWGDSHSLAWAPAFHRLFSDQGRSAYLAMNYGCPPLLGVSNLSYPECREANEAIIAQMRQRNDVRNVLMVASWTSYSAAGPYELRDDAGRSGNERIFPSALSRTIRDLSSSGKRIFLIGPTPGAPSDIPLRLALAEMTGRQAPPAVLRADFARKAAGFDAALQGVLAAHDVIYIDPRPWFCGKQGACSYLHANDLLYRDGGHLSVRGAEFLVPRLRGEMSHWGH